MITNAHNPRRGVGLVELLLALAISAAVLAAVAAATNAGFASYQANAAAGDAAQRARLVLDRGLALLRETDDDVDYLGNALDAGARNTSARATFQSGLVAHDTGFVVFAPVAGGFRRVEWRYDADAGALLQRTYEIDGTDLGEHVLLRGVDEFRMAFQPMRSSENRRRGIWTHDRLRRATMVLTVRTAEAAGVGPDAAAGGTFTLSGSASPRRNVGV
jgi:hypothetical protein